MGVHVSVCAHDTVADRTLRVFHIVCGCHQCRCMFLLLASLHERVTYRNASAQNALYLTVKVMACTERSIEK